MMYKIGDIVPYRNTRGYIKNAKITSFKTVDNGKVWFNGIDTTTKAKVWYPVHISEKLNNTKNSTDNLLFELPPEQEKEKSPYKCRQCIHMCRLNPYSDRYTYCSVVNSNRTPYGKLRVKPMQEACGLFSKKITK